MLATHPSEARTYLQTVREAPKIAPTTTLDDRLAQGTLRRIEAKEHVYCEGDPRSRVQIIESSREATGRGGVQPATVRRDWEP